MTRRRRRSRRRRTRGPAFYRPLAEPPLHPDLEGRDPSEDLIALVLTRAVDALRGHGDVRVLLQTADAVRRALEANYRRARNKDGELSENLRGLLDQFAEQFSPRAEEP